MATYKLNLIPGGAPVVVPVNQYDTGYEIDFEIYNGNTAYSLTGSTARIDIGKSDGNIFSGDLSISGSNVVTVELEEQMTAMWGPCIAEIVITTSSGRRGTANFILNVEKSPLEDGAESDSIINYVEASRSAAEQAITTVEGVIEEVTELVERAEAAAESAVAGGVASFNLRNGIVSPIAGDYSADMITYGNGTVEASLEALETKTTRMLTVTSGTAGSTPVSAETSENIVIPVTMTAECRYVPIAVVSFTMGTQYVYPWKVSIGATSYQADNGVFTSSTTIAVGVRNPHTTNYTASPTVYVLWIKSDN